MEFVEGLLQVAQRERRLAGQPAKRVGESDAERIKQLEKENDELRQTNGVLKKAMGVFAPR